MVKLRHFSRVFFSICSRYRHRNNGKCMAWRQFLHIVENFKKKREKRGKNHSKNKKIANLSKLIRTDIISWRLEMCYVNVRIFIGTNKISLYHHHQSHGSYSTHTHTPDVLCRITSAFSHFSPEKPTDFIYL